MGRTIRINLFNKNFGPVKDGLFLEAQKKAVERFGIGDGLFAPPPNSQKGHDHQLGFERQLRLKATVLFKDGTQQVWEDTAAFPSVDDSCPSVITLEDSKEASDITGVLLEVLGHTYAHSRSGGGGFSLELDTTLGECFIPKRSIKGKEINAVVALSDRWEPGLEAAEYESEPEELLKIEFISREALSKQQVDQDSHQASLVVAGDWRSTLAPCWKRDSRPYPTQFNIAYSHIWTYPIGIYNPGQPGWVIGINEGSRVTEAARAHVEAFKNYRETEGYQGEVAQWKQWFFGKSKTTSPSPTDAPENAVAPEDAQEPTSKDTSVPAAATLR